MPVIPVYRALVQRVADRLQVAPLIILITPRRPAASHRFRLVPTRMPLRLRPAQRVAASLRQVRRSPDITPFAACASVIPSSNRSSSSLQRKVVICRPRPACGPCIPPVAARVRPELSVTRRTFCQIVGQGYCSPLSYDGHSPAAAPHRPGLQTTPV